MVNVDKWVTMERWEAPLRVTSGSFVLQSGLGKRGMPAEAAEGLHGFAQTAQLPAVNRVQASTFVKVLSGTETALGAILLSPFVPRRVAGAALMAFSASLLRLYWKAPGLRQEGDVRPTQDGTAVAKDVWLFGIGLSLLLGPGNGRRGRRCRR